MKCNIEKFCIHWRLARGMGHEWVVHFPVAEGNEYEEAYYEFKNAIFAVIRSIRYLSE